MKKCTKCKLSKEESLLNFYKDSSKKDNLSSRCKDCILSYRNENRTKVNLASKKWRKNNPEKVKKIKREYRSNNLEKCRENDRNYYNKNKNTILTNSRKRYHDNKQYFNEKQRKYEASKKDCPLYKLKSRTRKLIHKAISRRGYTKRSKCNIILGCTWDHFKKHLEETFEFNYGIPRQYITWEEVHVDHIIPLSTANTEEDIIRLNHYKNLQLLLACDNMEKSDKLDWSL